MSHTDTINMFAPLIADVRATYDEFFERLTVTKGENMARATELFVKTTAMIHTIQTLAQNTNMPDGVYNALINILEPYCNTMLHACFTLMDLPQETVDEAMETSKHLLEQIAKVTANASDKLPK